MRLVLAGLLMLLVATACLTQKSQKGAAQTVAGGQANTGAQTATTNQSAGATASPTSFAKLFRGNIGGHPVEMKLRREGENLSGTYAYDGKSQSLTLKGRIDAQGKLALQEFDAAGKQTGQFDCQYSEEPLEGPSATIDGNWSAPGGKNESYVYLVEQLDKFTGGLQIVSKSIKERRFQIDAAYPQLTGSNERAITDFNQRVASIVEKAVREFKSVEPDPDKSSYTTNYNVMLASGDLVSVEINEDSYEGGAYPNTAHYALTYDLRAGRELSMDALFKPGSDYKTAIRRYSANNMNEREKAWNEKDGKKQDPNEGPSFSEDYPDLENWGNWAMSRQGVFVYYDLPHVAAALDRVFIPYSVLKDYINPNGPAAAFLNEKR